MNNLLILAQNPLSNISTLLQSFNELMEDIGMYLGYGALLITIVCIICAGEKRTPAYIRKAIIICLCVVALCNYTTIVDVFTDLFNAVFGTTT